MGARLQVDLSEDAGGEPAVPDRLLAQRFPRFPGRGAALECVVEAGMMLYLPAGGLG